LKLFEYALDALKNHEKELDQLTERLGKTKDQWSTNLQIFNSALDKLEAQLSCVEIRIDQTKRPH
jgi:hypothetical protein